MTDTAVRTTGRAAKPVLRARPGVEPIYWLFLFPAVAVFTLLITYPAVEGLTMSFTNSIGLGDFEWIGVRNYIALIRDENILSSYAFTFLFAAVSVILVNIIAFFLALGLTSKIRFTNPLRAVFVIPMVISAIIYSFVFRFLFNNSVTQFGQALGIEGLSTSLLANPDWAWLAIVIVSTWGSVPSAMLIYIAGLMTVPGEVYEASSIDGATPWQNLRHITLPLVVGYVGINMIIGFKNYLAVYDQIVGLTQGGPGTATRSVAFTIFAGFSGGGKAVMSTGTSIAPAVAGAAVTASRRGRIGQEKTNWTATLLLFAASLAVLVPLYVTAMMAFKTTQQSTDLNAFSLPSPVSFDGFVAAWNLTNFPRAFLVSLVVTLVSVTGSILVSSMAAYAIVRNWDRKLFRYAFFYLLAAMFIPFPVLALPQVRLTSSGSTTTWASPCFTSCSGSRSTPCCSAPSCARSRWSSRSPCAWTAPARGRPSGS